jgi:hypothetical protein
MIVELRIGEDGAIKRQVKIKVMPGVAQRKNQQLFYD